MKLKDKLKLMEEAAKRNHDRIRVFGSKPRKRPSSGFKKKTEDNRVMPKKPQ